MSSAPRSTSCNHNKSDTMLGDIDTQWMQRALQLAERGLCSTAPNPRVGCVIVKQNAVIAEGWHAVAGKAHAEIHALQQAGAAAQGATVYVTLEPCSHHGKTGPCCEALIAAGVARVVFAMQDPNPQVAGRGLQKLRDAGISTAGPLLEHAAQTLNAGFIKRMHQGVPWVRVKMAMSADGRTAMASGESQWITGEAARQDVQHWRARSCAIVTGIDTVLHDNAQLTVRDTAAQQALGTRKPLRVLLDTQARAPLSANIFSEQAPTLWCTAAPITRTLPAHIENLVLPLTDNNTLNLSALLTELGRRQCNEILVEAGATLAGAFIQQQLVDELLLYMAPCLLGSSARPLFNFAIDHMADAQRLHLLDAQSVGADWRFIFQPLH